MWQNGTIDGYKYHAKVYSVGSVFGINEGRVSKLSISKNGEWVYNYDRGLDFDNCPAEVLGKILATYKE